MLSKKTLITPQLYLLPRAKGGVLNHLHFSIFLTFPNVQQSTKMSTSVMDYVTFVIIIFTIYKCGQIQCGTEAVETFGRPLRSKNPWWPISQVSKVSEKYRGKAQTFLREVSC